MARIVCAKQRAGIILHEVGFRTKLREGNNSSIREPLVRAFMAVLLVLLALVLSVYRASAQSVSPQSAIPGWHQIPNTQLAAVCKKDDATHGVVGCRAVIGTWNGGVADTKRNRLVFWGGGHNDYYGNEVYAFDLVANKMMRLTEASSPPVPCKEVQPDGRPSSRHTYDNLAYIAHADLMYAFGGGIACEKGMGSNSTWILSFETLGWKKMDTDERSNPDGSRGFAVAAYDPASRKVYLNDSYALWEYDYEKNSYLRRNSNATIDNGMTGAIDSDRRLLIVFGLGKVRAFKIGPGGNYTMQMWDHQVKGCEALQNAVYPGLAYDPDLHRIVGWAGGDSVYLFDPETKSCSSQTFPGGPGEQQENGTYGRFAYFPALHAFSLVNDWRQDAFVLRLSPSP